jgi:hypothetical protein
VKTAWDRDEVSFIFVEAVVRLCRLVRHDHTMDEG